MGELALEISTRRCPHCKTLGSLRIQTAHATIVCIVCQRSFIDLFEIGPWDTEVIVDKLNGEVVSSYSEDVIETPVSDEDIEKLKAWADFEDWLKTRENVEGG